MINILFFASLSEQLGCEKIQLNLVKPKTVLEIKKQYINQGGAWLALKETSLLCSVNHNLANDNTLVNPNDEVAFFPPVTGG